MSLSGVRAHAASSQSDELVSRLTPPQHRFAAAQQMADRERQFRAVERVEVEVPHAARIELAAEFGRDRRGDELARAGMIVQPLEQPAEPAPAPSCRSSPPSG